MPNAYVTSALEALNSKFGNDYEFTVSKGGRKYHRIVQNIKPSQAYRRSSYMFIEDATGNVYKTASWNAPAKIVRHVSESPEELAQWLGENADPYGTFLYLR